MPGPVSLTVTRTCAPLTVASSEMLAPLGQNFRALSTRLAIARSKSSTSTAAATPLDVLALMATPRRVPRSAKRRATSSSRSTTSITWVLSLNSGSSSWARSPSECTSRAAFWVLRSATSTSWRSPARVSSAAQRLSSVSRQATVAVSGERRSCDRLLTPSRLKWSSRRKVPHCARSVVSIMRMPLLSWPNSSRVEVSGKPKASVCPLPCGVAKCSMPSRETAATTCVNLASGRVTAAVTQAATRVANATTTSIRSRAGCAKALCTGAHPPCGRMRLCATR